MMAAFAPAACTNSALNDEKALDVAEATEGEQLERQRESMAALIRSHGVKDESVLAAMRRVPRHEFVPPEYARYAYANSPLPIGHDQTISQPYIVALMTELLNVKKGDRVLEVGTGSGYQAAVLAEMGAEVYTIEIVEPLGVEAAKRLKATGYENVHARVGDGYKGWPEAAPFDGIIVTCAPDHVPEPLVAQLKVGGRMVIPVGPAYRDQVLYLKVKTESGELKDEAQIGVRFVPMTGERGAR